MNSQLKYLFTSTDGRQIDVVAYYVRNDTFITPATIKTNIQFEAQIMMDKTLPFQIGVTVQESILSDYAKGNGYTLKRINADGTNTTLNTASSAMPPITAGDDAGDIFISWTGTGEFEVQRSVHSPQSFSQKAIVGGNHSDSNVATGITYYYRVRQYDTGNGVTSAFSNVASFTAT